MTAIVGEVTFAILDFLFDYEGPLTEKFSVLTGRQTGKDTKFLFILPI